MVKMKARTWMTIAILLVAIPVGFYYYVSINGFSVHHAGIYVQILPEDQLASFGSNYEIKSVTHDDLMQFPQILTMMELLVDEKYNHQGTRSFFVGFETYRIFDSRGELKIKNHMSDSDTSNTYREFTERFGSSVILYDGNYFSVSRWIV